MNTKGKQLQLGQVLFLLSGVFLCSFCQLTTSARLYEPLSVSQNFGEDSTERIEETIVVPGDLEEPLNATGELQPTVQPTPEMHVLHHTDTNSDFKASTTTEPPPETPTAAPPLTTITPTEPDEAPHVNGEYPKDIFSIEDRRRGWVILHISGIMYMFVSLGIVCNEFFVPALWVITDKVAISNDVAGAIVMAAGRSSPKFFTALVGAFISHSNVGIGNIVGSAVYNILFVIGICALFSRKILHLTWWPLFRDVSFYILHLILLIIFFLDNVIMWWESMMLVAGYTTYVVFMKFNTQIVKAFKTQLHKDKGTVKVVALEEAEKVSTWAHSTENTQMVTVELLAGIDQIVFHTSNVCLQERMGHEDPDNDEDNSKKSSGDSSKNEDDENVGNQEEEGKKDKPLSLKWPVTQYKQVIYLFLLPIVFPLWLTVPDVRNQKSRKFYVVTFLVSILWINAFFYFMVWWAHRVGETIGISEEIMGLTILAAGTSIPDLITSVIVARKGLGDMAVSSSVGKNIFDIAVGLPVPWLLYSSIHGFAPVAVSSNGLFCAIALLFFMLLCFIISIASCEWKLNKVLGFTMLLFYIIFVVICVTLQYGIVVCPVSIGNNA
uniref:Sodium/potassium/calcium exchanger 1 n=1 Tax=Amphiprion ocellaris TaxID=80972 RepID=A0A3Q1CPZ2_AMPOC